MRLQQAILLTVTVILQISFAKGKDDGSPGMRGFRTLKVNTTVDEGEELSEEGVRALFTTWNDALNTLDAATVTSRYASKAVLLPTVSDIPRNTPELIQEYFVSFLQKKPQGVILEGKVRSGKNWALDSGIYEFTFGADNSKVKARYSYVYVKEDGDWKISQHHSSFMPEGKAVEHPITTHEIRDAFALWNDALSTEDPDVVGNRYSDSAVLLATLSDTPRTDPELRKDYFTTFLKKKPQGMEIDSYVKNGTNWAQDVGIYEFNFGEDNSTVKARYSFFHTYENGRWKIHHHHSSIMPSTIPPAPKNISTDEVRDLFTLWNDALATLNSTIVVGRYAKTAVLLPTVSDTTRNTSELIKEYFDSFLLKKPQGVILSGDIRTGNNWAMDVGLYEFTMGSDGSKVKARYTFVYVFEDDEWKIEQHQSSFMPESIL